MVMFMNLKLIETELSTLINQAISENEIPVACVITCGDKIIAKAYNKKNQSNCVLDHAEILAIKEASNIKNTWNLSDCTLYCTLKPCKMCEEVIKQSYIKEVYYILDKINDINYKYTCKQMYVNDIDFFQKKLKDFFINMR